VVHAQNITGFLKENGREISIIVHHKGLVNTMPCHDLVGVGFGASYGQNVGKGYGFCVLSQTLHQREDILVTVSKQGQRPYDVQM
jgi:hypothetical protein